MSREYRKNIGGRFLRLETKALACDGTEEKAARQAIPHRFLFLRSLWLIFPGCFAGPAMTMFYSMVFDLCLPIFTPLIPPQPPLFIYRSGALC